MNLTPLPRWVEVWVASGDAIRNTIPLGLHLTDPTTSFVRGGKRITLLPPAKDSVEDETRRSTFWLAYAVERFQAVGNGWATSVDDKSISQTFPALLDNFQRGVRTAVPCHANQSNMCIDRSPPKRTSKDELQGYSDIPSGGSDRFIHPLHQVKYIVIARQEL